VRFLTREQVRTVDRIAIEELGIPGTTLMENAGRGAAEVARRMVRARGARVTVVAGTGNNGGDGFVVARHLAASGAKVRVVCLGEPRTDDARAMLARIRRSRGVRIEGAGAAIEPADLVVDAILGTGLDREPTGEARRAIERLAGVRAPVLALDVPSGLDADTGLPLGLAVRATATATFVAPKRGLVTTPGIDHAGAVHVVSIGTPAELLDRTGWDGEVLEAADARALVPARPRSGHKGTFGHVLVVGGSPGRTGAAWLAATAALRTGSGLVTIAARGTAAQALDAKVVEAMTETLSVAPETAAERLATLASGKDALVVGPGLGVDAGAVVAAALAGSLPAVVDADALTILGRRTDALRGRTAPTVLTPHPGELSRLLGIPVAAVQSDRIGAARRAAEAAHATVVLKGARTVVAEPSGAVAVNSTGGPVLATAGSGDVLAGVVGSLLGAGLGASEAARLGVYLHGLAGDLCAADGRDRGVLASEVAAALPAAVRALRG
jgi:NAD(P)H-hydrate epimerase